MVLRICKWSAKECKKRVLECKKSPIHLNTKKQPQIGCLFDFLLNFPCLNVSETYYPETYYPRNLLKTFEIFLKGLYCLLNWERVYESLTNYSYEIYEMYPYLMKMKKYLDEMDRLNRIHKSQ